MSRSGSRTPHPLRIPLAVSLIATLAAAVAVGFAPAAGAVEPATATVVAPGAGDRPLSRGGSATAFTLDLGRDPTCPGDSAGANFRLQSFMVPASASLDALRFGANGPAVVAGEFRQPLFAVDSSPYVDELTDVAVPPETTGGISQLPAFDFAVFSPGDVPAGDYAIGIACTRGPAGADQVRALWRARISVTVAADDRPAGITWRTAAPATVPTATAATRAGGGDGAGGTGRAGGGGGGPTTTTTPADGTTTTTTEVALAGTEPSEPSVADTIGALPLTGSTPGHLLVWGVVLLLVGRVVYLLARRPRVVSPGDD